MKIIFAQGNPGNKYTTSRHNVGFLALDSIANSLGATFTTKTKFHADIAEATISGEKVILVKPSTFYNETGRAARLLCDFYKASPVDDFLAIHDDLALPLGTIRTRQKGSDAGNNGIKSLNSHLGPDYHRVRVGVYNDLRDRVDDVNFVLGSFTKTEADHLNKEIIPKIEEIVNDFCAETFTTTSYKI